MIMLRSASSFAFSGRSLLAISQSSSTRFEVAARRCSSSSASMQIRTATTKRRMATLAALFTVTSATALAAGPSKNNEHHLGWNLKSATDTALCEGEKSTKNAHDQILPESILKYDHYNGVIIHLDWLFNQTTATTINGAVNGDDQSEVDDREQLQQLKQEWEQSPDIFETLLKNSLQKWKQEGRKGIWVHVPRNMAAVVPVRTFF